MQTLRWGARACALAAVVALAACGSDDGSSGSTESTAVVSNSDHNSRGAVEASLGEAVARPDGAYTLTMTKLVEHGQNECSTYGESRTPASDGIRLISAHMLLDTGPSIPPGAMPTYVPNFYAADASGLVKSDIAAGGEYSCNGDGEGRAAANQNPMPNARIERIETFMVPVGSKVLGYRESQTRSDAFAIEWPLDAVTQSVGGDDSTVPGSQPGSPQPPLSESESFTTAPPPTSTAPITTNPVDQVPNPYPNSFNSDGQPSGQGGGTLTGCAPLDMYQPGTGVFTKPDGTTYFDYAAQCLQGGSMR